MEGVGESCKEGQDTCAESPLTPMSKSPFLLRHKLLPTAEAWGKANTPPSTQEAAPCTVRIPTRSTLGIQYAQPCILTPAEEGAVLGISRKDQWLALWRGHSSTFLSQES